ncbi:hypothetical protein OIV83_000517 [Microbotryomycetes sp. JL201]|nr:hypothetical protein OIV83_000517 [Microbotryomycetes sp. JL201]
MPPRKRSQNDHLKPKHGVQAKDGHPRLLTHDELEPWRIDNAYIITGYRPTLNSYKLCFESVFAAHNETVNIWTHALGSIVAVAHRWNQLDYLGIVVLISGTFVPAVRYGFFCDPHLRTLYISAIYIAGAGTAYTVLAPHARTPEYRRFRAWVFIGMGLSAVVPVGHAVVRYGLERASQSLSLQWLALGGFLYILGAVLYAERVPERFAPGRFDIVGASHQIFHVLILLAAWSHWCAIAEGYRYWHEERAGVCWTA